MRPVEWKRDGWLPAGPRQCRCTKCGNRVSTNAFVRRAHQGKCDEKQLAASLKRIEELETRLAHVRAIKEIE